MGKEVIVTSLRSLKGVEPGLCHKIYMLIGQKSSVSFHYDSMAGIFNRTHVEENKTQLLRN